MLGYLLPLTPNSLHWLTEPTAQQAMARMQEHLHHEATKIEPLYVTAGVKLFSQWSAGTALPQWTRPNAHFKCPRSVALNFAFDKWVDLALGFMLQHHSQVWTWGCERVGTRVCPMDWWKIFASWGA